MKILTIILSLMITIPQLTYGSPNGEKEWKIVIENDYQRDSKIWGTYGQTKEKTSLLKNKKTISEKRNPAANMMLKNGKMVLIQPVTVQGLTKYKVRQFPYKKKKGRRYNVQLANDKGKFLDIYKNQLMAVLKKNNIKPNQVDWNSLEINQMSCKSKRKNFNCKIPLRIKTRPNS